MLRTLLLAASLALLPACVSPSDTFTADGLVLRAGTSFGMCLGYCTTELRVTPDELVFVESSRDPAANPERTRRLPLTEAEWEEIVSLARPSQLEGLPEVFGCPDCADGGAEWIEVEHEGTKRRVTFEYGSTIERIQPLVEKARELRDHFPRQ